MINDSVYLYEAQDDMVDETAQYFARYLFDQWDVGRNTCQNADDKYGILIFVSIEVSLDRSARITFKIDLQVFAS